MCSNYSCRRSRMSSTSTAYDVKIYSVVCTVHDMKICSVVWKIVLVTVLTFYRFKTDVIFVWQAGTGSARGCHWEKIFHIRTTHALQSLLVCSTLELIELNDAVFVWGGLSCCAIWEFQRYCRLLVAHTLGYGSFQDRYPQSPYPRVCVISKNILTCCPQNLTLRYRTLKGVSCDYLC